MGNNTKAEEKWINAPRVTITWADHWSDYEQGFSLDDIEKMARKPCLRKTTGHLLPIKSKRNIVVAGTIEEDGSVSEVFICMRRAVIDVEYLD